MLRLSVLMLFQVGALIGFGQTGSISTTAYAAPADLNLDPLAIRAHMESVFRQQGVKAMLATVRSGEQEVVSLAQGESMTGVPATLDQRVRIGGVAQSYLGTMLMLLVERGELKLEDKISKWLPELPRSADVTVEMLITSTSGYKDYVTEEAFLADLLANPFRHFTREDLLSYVMVGGQLNFEPDTHSRYAHTNLVVLAKLLEKATGKSMAKLYRDVLLDRLNLEKTNYSSTAEMEGTVLHAYGSDRDVFEDITFWSPSWAADSGPLYAPIDEVARWARVHGKGQLLSPQSQARLTARPAAAPAQGTYYAFGFVVADGWYFFNPNFNGYSGTCAYNPSLDLTIVVYTTNSPASVNAANPAFAATQGLAALIAPAHPLSP